MERSSPANSHSSGTRKSKARISPVTSQKDSNDMETGCHGRNAPSNNDKNPQELQNQQFPTTPAKESIPNVNARQRRIGKQSHGNQSPNGRCHVYPNGTYGGIIGTTPWSLDEIIHRQGNNAGHKANQEGLLRIDTRAAPKCPMPRRTLKWIRRANEFRNGARRQFILPPAALLTVVAAARVATNHF